MSNKQLDVLFIHPNASKKIYQDLSKDFSAIEPPIWAALLANHVRHAGYEVKILDCEAERLGPAESASRLNDFNARLNVLVVYGQQPSASTQNMEGVSDLLNELRDKFDGNKVLLVGLHPSAVSRQALKAVKTDFVCQGEGPYTITKLLEINMGDKEALADVPGLWYWDDDKVKANKPAPIVPQKELATQLPGMAWDLLPMDKYRTSNWHAMSNGGIQTPFASLYTSLGCPFQCSFCCINAPFGNNNVENWDYQRNKFRFWDTDFIIEEFESIHKMGIKNIKIADEMFVLNKNHFMTVCEKIIERGYDFNIWAYARIDTVKEEYLATLKSAGVNWLALGIESGNTAVRKDVVKGKFTEVNIRDLVKKIQDAGINVIGNYIFGLPEDNLETMEETLQLAIDLNCEFANFYCTMAYPGSKLYLDALQHDWELPDNYVGYSQHSYECKPLPTKHLPAKEVLRFRDTAFNRYYDRPEYFEMVTEKFGTATADNIKKMLTHKLKRKLLET
tara:strand:+ start:6010 stop:7524 length:1515 start_codon:yes stop_codon:yes gene_type:complete